MLPIDDHLALCWGISPTQVGGIPKPLAASGGPLPSLRSLAPRPPPCVRSAHLAQGGTILGRGSPYHRQSLRRRILLWFLVLSLVPLLVSNSVGYLVSRGILRSHIQRYVGSLVLREAARVGRAVDYQLLHLTTFVYGNPLLLRAIREATTAPVATSDLQALLRQQHVEQPVFRGLVVLDTVGRMVAATGNAPAPHDPVRAGWFEEALRGPYFGVERPLGERGNRPVYRLAVPISDDRGRVLAVLAATVGMENARAFLMIPPHLAEDMHSYIVDAAHMPVAVPHEHGAFDYEARLDPPPLNHTEEEMERYENFEGEAVLGVAAPIPGLPWTYVAEVPVATAYGRLQQLGVLALVMEAAFALLLVAVVWIVARSIVSPLRQLVGAAERIRGGELGVTVDIDRVDELGELGRTFNTMSTELQASTDQISTLHDQELRRAAQLASVGELAAGIAHEIKNPVMGIGSGLDLLSAKLSPHETTYRLLRQMREQLDRIDSAIRDLLSYARPKAPRRTIVKPGQLISRVAGLVTAQADAAGVEIREQAADGVSISVDPEQMTQALVNFALNGIQAMDAGGVLSITTTVTDTGSGISPEDLSEIFRPFYTTKHRGTGLGLAISRSIAERHGGSVAIESVPGTGTSVTLVLPRAPESA